jgi:hypothetical protein
MVHKWEGKPADAPCSTPDASIAEKFHAAFVQPVPEYKWEALDELFVLQGAHQYGRPEVLC